MKTVLHLIETCGPGGAEQMLIRLVQNLEEKEYRSIICLLKDGWLNATLNDCGYSTVIIPQRKGMDPMWTWRCIKLIRERRVDLLHTHEFAMNVYGSMAARIVGVPAIATVHGKGYSGDRWRRRLAYRCVGRYSSRMVCVSEDVRRFVIDRVGVRSDNVVTIYNGIDAKAYSPSEERAQVRKELGIADRAPVVGTIGNLYPVKGQRYLLAAAVRVLRSFPATLFLLVGRGRLLGELQDQASKLGIAGNVRFLGFREDVRTILQALDIFILPSLSEGLPVALLEAMAAGKPVVATDVGGNPEVILDGETGFLVPPRDPASLASKIMRLLNDHALACRLAMAGQRRVHECFTLERMVDRYQDLYQEALLKR